MKPFFTKENLHQLKEELGQGEVSFDQRVDDFLLQIGHDFIHQSLVMTIQLQKTLPVGSSVTDETLLKYAMGELIRKSLRSSGLRDFLVRIEKNQKAQKSGQKTPRPKN